MPLESIKPLEASIPVRNAQGTCEPCSDFGALEPRYDLRRTGLSSLVHAKMHAIGIFQQPVVEFRGFQQLMAAGSSQYSVNLSVSEIREGL